MAESSGASRGLIPPHVLWPGLVVTLISISVGFAAITAYFALSDPSATVVPDYYQRALDWDESAGRRAASEALGWKAGVSVDAAPNAAGLRAVRVRLVDSEGAALAGLSVRLSAFAHVRAREVQHIDLEELGDGFYAGPIRVLHPGLWQIQIEAEGPVGRFLHDESLWVASEAR
ncbi:MAG: FixH family protein [Phycisphaeraceae bacterium]|nr:FixH family protein [Phycisphaeraceae bacterium]